MLHTFFCRLLLRGRRPPPPLMDTRWTALRGLDEAAASQGGPLGGRGGGEVTANGGAAISSGVPDRSGGTDGAILPPCLHAAGLPAMVSAWGVRKNNTCTPGARTMSSFTPTPIHRDAIPHAISPLAIPRHAIPPHANPPHAFPPHHTLAHMTHPRTIHSHPCPPYAVPTPTSGGASSALAPRRLVGLVRPVHKEKWYARHLVAVRAPITAPAHRRARVGHRDA